MESTIDLLSKVPEVGYVLICIGCALLFYIRITKSNVTVNDLNTKIAVILEKIDQIHQYMGERTVTDRQLKSDVDNLAEKIRAIQSRVFVIERMKP